MFEGMTSVQHAKSGKVRILAVTTAKRSPVMPDVPTVSEAGLPGYEVNSWYIEKGKAGVNSMKVLL
jgi:tripartite-type tricarboxylate transporter receptor subunit TctC